MMKDLSQSEEQVHIALASGLIKLTIFLLCSMNKKYQELRMSTGKEATNLTVNVLSQGQWPP